MRPVDHAHARHRSAARRVDRPLVLTSASRAARLAEQVMWIVKASAHSPELVQMFDVAFLAADMLLAGRQRQHEAALALPRRLVSPASRPGICRTYFVAQANRPDIGPAELQADADRLALATTMSAPISPGL
jgi:hypothetical protein